MTKIISTDAIINSIRLTEQVAAPTTPASGYFQIYAKDDGKLYGESDAGTESCLQLSSGSGITVSGGNINLATGMVQQTELFRSTLSASGIFDITSISQDYDCLIARLVVQSTVTASYNDTAKIYINNDTTDSNYRSIYADTSIENKPDLAYLATAKDAAGFCSTYELQFLNYKSGIFMKTIHVIGHGQGDSTYVSYGVIRRNNIEALNRITIRPDGYPTDVFSVGSFCQLIGVKTI